MFAALAYKEWLKLRLVFWVPLAAVLVALALALVDFRHVNEMIGPVMLWYDVALLDKVFYSDLRYVFVCVSVWFALFQFVPECTDNRLRLLFHLPVPRRKAVYFMVGVGLICTAVVGLAAVSGLACIVGAFMPVEAVCIAVLTCAPWLLASIPAYLGTVLVVMEPAWPHKFVHGAVTALFVHGLTASSMQGAYEHTIVLYALGCLLWILPIELAAFRVKRGGAW
ncbi:hypothetical protein [Salidesulfovibrio onnuriiensis]|uniref:hypothetical protein n=1 Tax=Salidesulfovibrio onnuriiensis TaxID=2583823 RepID=UPI0011C75A68|nr:hypothetical protein [Salidesulfovibrio onnuriiensis]